MKSNRQDTSSTKMEITTFREAIDQANEAANLIHRGYYSEAAALLPCSLQSMKQLVAWQSTTSSPIFSWHDNFSSDRTRDGCDSESPKESSSCDQVLDEQWITTTSWPATSDARRCEENQIHLETRPIHLDFLRRFDCSMQKEDVLIALYSSSAAIIFNLGLALHLSTMGLANNQGIIRIRLVKVRALYELAHEIFVRNDDMLMLDLVDAQSLVRIVNNLGVIHLQLDNTQGGADCFESLLSILMLMVDQGDILVDDECGCLFRNALVAGGHISSTESRAPAA
jgi:hypothetical protein